jgi:hypothetical protein
MNDRDPQITSDWIAKQLRESLQALAMPANIQLEIFPDGANIPSELLADIITWSGSYIEDESGKLPTDLHDKLENAISVAMDLYEINRKYGWDRNRLASGEEWQRGRDVATDLLALLGWPVERPMRWTVSLGVWSKKSAGG